MNLKKFTIIGYTDNLFTEPKAGGSYSVQINPSSFSNKHTINYTFKDPAGKPYQIIKFKSFNSSDVSIKFTIDNTGAISNKIKSVSEEIEKIQSTVYTFDGKIHRPVYLLLSWGTFIFKCVLSTFDVSYQLFDTEGQPLRAEISLMFKDYKRPEEAEQEANKKSADLTHLYIVKAGDNLPSICNKYYGKPDYYLQVAKFNRLASFRHLKPGLQLTLPPLISSH